ncbi:hypothetical protein BJ912DRAFT_1068853 [Pholiota molesta]|nr:hypothetical protein BJ912DRAFT_1068853 [Pholiota molesta]
MIRHAVLSDQAGAPQKACTANALVKAIAMCFYSKPWFLEELTLQQKRNTGAANYAWKFAEEYSLDRRANPTIEAGLDLIFPTEVLNFRAWVGKMHKCLSVFVCFWSPMLWFTRTKIDPFLSGPMPNWEGILSRGHPIRREILVQTVSEMVCQTLVLYLMWSAKGITVVLPSPTPHTVSRPHQHRLPSHRATRGLPGRKSWDHKE